jgi:hypothetical protein
MERGPWSLREQWHIIQVNESWVWIAGEQGSLTTKLVHLFDSKPSIVNNGQLITSPGTTWRKWNIMPASGQPSLTVMKLVVWKLYSLNSYMLPFLFCPLVSTGHMHSFRSVKVLLKGCNLQFTYDLNIKWNIEFVGNSSILLGKPHLIQYTFTIAAAICISFCMTCMHVF